MEPIKSFIARADAYAARQGLKRTTVSKKLFDTTDKLDDLAAGTATVTLKSYEAAIQTLAALEAAEATA